MRRFVFFVFVVACHSREQEQVAPIAESASVTPVVSAAPSASAAPVVSAVVVDGTGTITLDAGKRDDKDAARRAKLEREIEAQQLQILAVLGSDSHAHPESVLRNDNRDAIDLANALTAERDAGSQALVIGGGGGGKLSGLRDTRDH